MTSLIADAQMATPSPAGETSSLEGVVASAFEHLPSPSFPCHIVSLSLGPVQDFIASARRCRDLWFGSWLLSELSKAAAQAVHEEGATLIFPSPATLDELAPASDLNVANKIIALCSTPQAVAEKAEDAARLRLDEIANGAFDRVREDPRFLEEVACKQIGDLLEWTWASVRVASEAEFASARRQVESLMGARKNLRDFAPVAWSDCVPKSSLDGQRESVIHEDAYEQLSPEELFRAFGVRRGERLCGVGILKRHGQWNDQGSRIYSSSHVAAQTLLQRWNAKADASPDPREERAALRKHVTTFVRELRALTASKSAWNHVPVPDPIFGWLDGQLLFEERLGEFFLPVNLLAAKKALSRFLSAMEGATAVQPLPYYALLLADGDRMGAAISRAASRGENQNITRLLAAFASNVGRIVAHHRGSLIYAGGDDVLALLPLHSALECARELSDEFALRLREVASSPEEAPTLSAGLAVVHHLEPLSESLDLARQAEKRAKAHPGKNALCVALAKRSGAEFFVCAGWGQTPTSADGLDGRLQTFIDWTNSGELARGLAYEWRMLALRFAETPSDEREVVRSIVASEARRLLSRKRERGGNQGVADVLQQQLLAMLAQAPSDSAPHAWLMELSQELVASRDLGAARRLAVAAAPRHQEVTP